MTTTLDIIQGDALILLERALLNKNLVFFGEDGGGKHGRSVYPVTAHVNGIDVTLASDDEDNPSDIWSCVFIRLLGYDSDVTGHAITDQNLRICLNQLLSAEHLDPTCLDWAHVDLQLKETIVLDVNIGKLLQW